MKNFKKIASAIAALSLAACMVAPVATMTSFAYDVTINQSSTDTSNATHKYKAYQVFTGKASEEKGKTILSNIDWGTGVNGSALLTALKDLEYAEKDIYPDDEEKNTSEAKVKPFDRCTNAKDVADVLADFADDSVVAKDFAEKVGANLITTNTTGTYSATDGMKITDLTDGYYLIMDDGEPTTEGTAKPNSSAMTRFMLKVVGGNVEVTTKVAAPSVDKQVLDNDTDTATDETDKNVGDSTQKAVKATESGLTGYWGETADHAIGETFQFKLTAQLPTGTEIDEYDAYKLVFNDTIGEGVDFNNPLNMKLYLNNGTEKVIDILAKADAGDSPKAYYEKDPDGKKITITIPDVKKLDGVSNLSGTTVSVVYDAHLNTSADVLKKTGSTTKNKNTVNLEYSNNPNVHGEGAPGEDTGKTPDDSVWVFTYEVDNKKVAGDKSNAPLSGAKFKLYKGNKATVGDGSSATALNFTNADGTYTFASTDGSAEIVSADDSGIFNFKGLDAGTYTLIETDAPAGYNTVDPIEIVIGATHAETADSNNATLNITQNGSPLTDSTGEDPYIQIVDEKGATLPSTGGIGTTLFYLGGGALVAVAGVMLITKKRMTKE